MTVSSKRKLHCTGVFSEALEPRTLFAAESAISADSFVDTMGINTHWPWTNVGGNGYLPSVNSNLPALLGQLGIRHDRDNVSSIGQSLYDNYGIKTNVAVTNFTTPVSGWVDALATPYVESIEGANEPDNFPRTYDGYSDTFVSDTADHYDLSATRRFQNQLYAAVKSDPRTSAKPVVSPALGNVFTDPLVVGMAFDIRATHPYPRGGEPAGGAVDSSFLASANGMDERHATTPLWATEDGYNTSIAQQQVSDLAQGKYIPRMFLENYLHGYQRTYAYELVDLQENASLNEDNFGLINHNGTPKPAYTNLKNLISLLGESTWSTSTKQWNTPAFTPGSLDYTLGTTASSIHHLLTQKSNGEYDLMLWNETPSYANNADITVPATPVTLTFNTNIASGAIYGLSSATPTQTFNGVSTLTVNVTDSVTVVRLVPGTIPVTTQTIGSPAVAGSASLSGSTYTIAGSGADIGGASDQMRFAYQTLTGDADIVARVNSLNATDSGAKAGIMIRQSLAATALTSGLYYSPSQTVSFISRQTGGSAATYSSTAVPGPYWLKLSRRGNVFSAYVSTSGAAGTWSAFGPSYTVPMTGTIYAGLAVTSHNVSNTATAAFDNVTISGPQVTGASAVPDSSLLAAPVVTVAATDASVGEGGGSLATNSGVFTFTRTGSTAAALTVNYTLGGNATNGTDYASLPGSIVIPAGASSTTLTLTPTTDSLVEGNETAALSLTDAATYFVGTRRTDSVSIIDYAPDLVVSGISWSPRTAVNGEMVQFTVTVKNIGTAPVPAGKTIFGGVRFDKAGDVSISGSSNAGLGAGNSVPLLMPLRAMTPGTHVVWGVVDTGDHSPYSGSIVETNELNNVIIKQMVVGQSRLSDDFQAATAGTAPSNWTTIGDGWTVKDEAGQKFLENTTTGTGTRGIARALGSAYTGSWLLDFKNTWRFGGFTDGSGQSSLWMASDLVDASGNGYRIKWYSGTSHTLPHGNAEVQLIQMTGNVEGTVLASSAAFNGPGWKSLNLAAPNWRSVRVGFDRPSSTLTIFADLAGTGDYQRLILFTDAAAPANFTTLGFTTGGIQNSVAPELDDINLTLLN